MGRSLAKKLRLIFSPTQGRCLATKQEVNDLPFPQVLDLSWHIQATFFLSVVGSWGKCLLGLGNNVEIYNHGKFLNSINNRPSETPLITVCNHTSLLDDPTLVATLINWRTLFDSKRMRWSLAAKEICFKNRLFSYMCSHGKVIPVVRGEGVHQAAVDFSIKRLNKGDWVHIFPEAKITLEPIRLKWGVGRMMAECSKLPIVLPFYHVGMDDFLPTRKPYFPRLGKTVTVLVGEPIDYSNVIKTSTQEKWTEIETRKRLTDLIQDSFVKLKVETEKLHAARITS